MKSSSKPPLRIKGSLLLLALNWMKYLTTFEVVDKVIVAPPSSNPWGFTADAERIRLLLNRVFGLRIESKYDLYVYTVTATKPCCHVLRHLLHDNAVTLASVELYVERYFKDDPESAEPGSVDPFRLLLTQLAEGRLKPEELMAGPEETVGAEGEG